MEAYFHKIFSGRTPRPPPPSWSSKLPHKTSLWMIEMLRRLLRFRSRLLRKLRTTLRTSCPARIYPLEGHFTFSPDMTSESGGFRVLCIFSGLGRNKRRSQARSAKLEVVFINPQLDGTKNATWRWCEPTCQYHDLGAGLNPCDIWPTWPLTLTHVTIDLKHYQGSKWVFTKN